jgi:hypothetical protein
MKGSRVRFTWAAPVFPLGVLAHGLAPFFPLGVRAHGLAPFFPLAFPLFYPFGLVRSVLEKSVTRLLAWRMLCGRFT